MIIRLAWRWAVGVGCLFSAADGAAQAPSSLPRLIYTQVAQPPRLPDGSSGPAAIQAAVQQRLVYHPKAGGPPLKATDGAIVTFVVSATGDAGSVRVLTSLGPAFEQAVRKAITGLPVLTPGRQEGEAVGVFYSFGVGAAGRYKYDPQVLAKMSPPPGWAVNEPFAWEPPRLLGPKRFDLAIDEHMVYPPAGAFNPTAGQVVVTLNFTVDQTGHLTEILVDPSTGLAYNRAAVQTLLKLPLFKPGTYQGKPVAVRLTRSILFPRPEQLEQARQEQARRPPPTDMDELLAGASVAELVPSRDSTTVYTYVEQMPRLPQTATAEAIAGQVQQTVKVPAEVRGGKVKGRVLVAFVVGPSGMVHQVKITKSLSPACDAAVLAAVAKLPRLLPGRQNGEKVAVALTIPVTF